MSDHTIFPQKEKKLDVKWTLFIADEKEEILVLCAQNPRVIVYIESLESQIK